MAVHTQTRIAAAISTANQHRTLKMYFAFLIFLSIMAILWNYNLKLPMYTVLPSSLTSRTVKMTTSDSSKKVDYRTSSASMSLRTMSPQLVERDYDCAEQYYRNESWRDDVIDPGPPYQCAGDPGRLGNVMFAYASSLGVASLSNRTVVVRPTNPLLSHFKLKAVLDCRRELCEKAKKKYDGGCCRFNPKVLQPEPQAPVLKVLRYLQCWRYFAHVEKEVRAQFTTYGDTAKQAANVIKSVRREFGGLQGAVTLVGVHVRHGDVSHKRFQNFGYQVPSIGYFYRAMAWYLRKFSRVVFVISSDRKEYVMENIIPLCENESMKDNSTFPTGNKQYANGTAAFRFQPSRPHYRTKDLRNRRGKATQDGEDQKKLTKDGHDSLHPAKSNISEVNHDTNPKGFPVNGTIDDLDHPRLTRREANEVNKPEELGPLPGARCRYAGTHKAVVDLAVLASCDHFIMSMGTYGWWAAWLTGGVVVYYKHPAREGSRYSKHFNGDDFFPPHWIPME